MWDKFLPQLNNIILLYYLDADITQYRLCFFSLPTVSVESVFSKCLFLISHRLSGRRAADNELD